MEESYEDIEIMPVPYSQDKPIKGRKAKDIETMLMPFSEDLPIRPKVGSLKQKENLTKLKDIYIDTLESEDLTPAGV